MSEMEFSLTNDNIINADIVFVKMLNSLPKDRLVNGGTVRQGESRELIVQDIINNVTCIDRDDYTQMYLPFFLFPFHLLALPCHSFNSRSRGEHHHFFPWER